jgi:hypothetical protein
MKIFIEILEIVSTLLTVLFGGYAALKETKFENGKLNKHGKIAFYGIIISGLISIIIKAGQTYQDHKETEEKLIQQKIINDSLLKVNRAEQRFKYSVDSSFRKSLAMQENVANSSNKSLLELSRTQQKLQANLKQQIFLTEKADELLKPLFPIKLEGEVIIDYSNAEKNCMEAIDGYISFLNKYIDDKGTYLYHTGKELPRNFILSRDRVTHFKFEMKFFTPQIDSALIHFWLSENSFIRTVFPDSKLAFIQARNFTNYFTEDNANLLIQLAQYSLLDTAKILFSYTLDFKSKKINLKFSIDDPIILKDDGIIKSISSCKNGWIGLGLESQKWKGITSVPFLITLHYGLQYKQKIDLTYKEGYSFPWKIVNDDFWQYTYYFKRGNDVMKQLK